MFVKTSRYWRGGPGNAHRRDFALAVRPGANRLWWFRTAGAPEQVGPAGQFIIYMYGNGKGVL